MVVVRIGLRKCELTIATAAPDIGFVEVSVFDTGHGLSEEVASRLFQPFVTTKASGIGSLRRGRLAFKSDGSRSRGTGRFVAIIRRWSVLTNVRTKRLRRLAQDDAIGESFLSCGPLGRVAS